jgi:Domain of unknown function (DUF1918)
MKANVGDWLVVKSRAEDRHARRAEIVAVGEGGSPPFTVRWLDDGHEALTFPGPDAEVISPERLAELDRAAAERSAKVQDEIRKHAAPFTPSV